MKVNKPVYQDHYQHLQSPFHPLPSPIRFWSKVGSQNILTSDRIKGSWDTLYKATWYILYTNECSSGRTLEPWFPQPLSSSASVLMDSNISTTDPGFPPQISFLTFQSQHCCLCFKDDSLPYIFLQAVP